MTSLTGLIVVFTVLVVLALATILIARAIEAVSRRPLEARPVQTAAVCPEPVEELGDVVAVLQGALSLETGIPVDMLTISSIKSLSDNTAEKD